MSNRRIRTHATEVLAVAFALWAAASAQAFVGVQDACPMPTPYPPAGAGWASVNNSGFEGAFANGAAERWVAWKDPQWTNQVFWAGSDRPYEGVYSQKLWLPRPSVDMQEAGVYQQVYVVPGGMYTVSVRVYLAMSGSTSGEHLLAFLGVNPYGDNLGDAGSTTWQEVSRLNEWRQASITIQAVFPVLTVSLKGTRKWPLGGDAAYVWFDAVTISGPVPTDPPPEPEPDPVDPATLIPETTGPNLAVNGSFEQAFTNGVCDGWSPWWTAGSGTWKRSQRVGKIGGAKYDCYGEAENVAMRTKTVLLISGDPIENPNNNGVLGTVDVFNQVDYMQDTVVVGRPFIDGHLGQYFANPTYYGRALADGCKILQDRWPRIDCWQGLNEPDWDVNWQSTLDFEYAFTQRAHELGLKTCVLNLATGNPGKIWHMVDERFSPSCHDLLEIADYLGHHVYGGPTDGFMVTNQVANDACAFALRPRRFKDMYDRRGWRFPPVIATEGSTWFPWHGNATPDRVTQDLLAMGDYMTFNRWWCGYTNFVVGAMCSWPDFDIVGQYLTDGRSMAEAIGQWNQEHVADATDGYSSQMFGAGYVHPKTPAQAVPAGRFTGGVNQQIFGLAPGREHVVTCWMKWEFRGHQPTQVRFYIGVDPTGQTANGNAGTIDWGDDQVATKAVVHETFTQIWRTFTAAGETASLWLRADHAASDPSVMFYVDSVEVRRSAISAAPGDYDSDGDVDLSDFAFFQACFNGPNRPPALSECSLSDGDTDGDVDLADFARFQSCFNGPNRPAACS